MRSFDGAEVCELVGLYLLNSLAKRFGSENIGLYCDDGLALIKCTSGRLADKVRKDLCAQFLEFGLKITAEVNHHVVNFLDVTFNLRDSTKNRKTTHCTSTGTQITLLPLPNKYQIRSTSNIITIV